MAFEYRKFVSKSWSVSLFLSNQNVNARTICGIGSIFRLEDRPILSLLSINTHNACVIECCFKISLVTDDTIIAYISGQGGLVLTSAAVGAGHRACPNEGNYRGIALPLRKMAYNRIKPGQGIMQPPL